MYQFFYVRNRYSKRLVLISNNYLVHVLGNDVVDVVY